MDSRNNSIQNPSTRQIQDTRMRCLVKCTGNVWIGCLYLCDGGTSRRRQRFFGSGSDKGKYGEFVKTGGEIVGANDSASYIKLIAPFLKDQVMYCIKL